MFNILLSWVDSLYAQHIEIKQDLIDPFKSEEVSYKYYNLKKNLFLNSRNNILTFTKASKKEFNITKSSFTEVGTLDISKPIKLYVICLAFKSRSGDFNNFNRPAFNKMGVAWSKVLDDLLKKKKK